MEFKGGDQEMISNLPLTAPHDFARVEVTHLRAPKFCKRERYRLSGIRSRNVLECVKVGLPGRRMFVQGDWRLGR